jgi:hypothetical protein
MRCLYRVRQFLRHLVAHESAVDLGPARRVLSGEALTLFQRMSPGDQRHGIEVLARLRAQGAVPDDLAAAALLHDAGKALAGRAPFWRAAVVLLGRRGRGVLGRLASSRPTSWRYPLYVSLHHAALGADLCRQAGCSPAVVRLVRLHDAEPEALVDGAPAEPEFGRRLAALRAADDAS